MHTLAFSSLLLVAQAFAQTTPPASAASQYSLTTSTTIPFPTATLDNSDTQSFITSNWGLSKGRIQNGASNLVFVADPFANSSGDSSPSGPVLQVQYPAGSFQDNNAGGAQMYALWNSSGSAFQSMMISYEVAFDSGFDWVKGGKLPGLRGGPDPNNCSGGNQANGTNCFSSRLMWRTNGAGEGASITFSVGRGGISHLLDAKNMPIFRGQTISAATRAYSATTNSASASIEGPSPSLADSA
jgi:hypothetical protein